jgi:hypothetical protein
VKAEQLDEHQDHFVVDTTIIKVRSVNEATDRTVSLPVPTAMTASDVVTGVYASLASLCAPAQVLAPATELHGSFKKNPKRKLDRAGEPQPSERLGHHQRVSRLLKRRLGTK